MLLTLLVEEQGRIFLDQVRLVVGSAKRVFLRIPLHDEPSLRIFLRIPLDEQSAASNDRNGDTISIEVCHPDSTGKFSDVTYDRLIELTAWLCSEFGLDEDDVIRHYDITGKNCPKYFVENEEAWEQFRRDVKEAL